MQRNGENEQTMPTVPALKRGGHIPTTLARHYRHYPFMVS
jgi:hypothetical protein